MVNKSRLIALGEIIAGAALNASGIGVPFAQKLTAMGIMSLAASFGNKPKDEGLPREGFDALENMADPLRGLPIPYGNGAVGLQRVFIGSSVGNQSVTPGVSMGRYLWVVGALGHGPIHHINSVYLDGRLALVGDGAGRQYLRAPSRPSDAPDAALSLKGSVAGWVAYGTGGQKMPPPLGYTSSTYSVTASVKDTATVNGKTRNLRKLSVSSAPYQVGDIVHANYSGASNMGLSKNLGYIVHDVNSTHVWVYKPGEDNAPTGSVTGTLDYYTPCLWNQPYLQPITSRFTEDMQGKGLAWLVLRLTYDAELFPNVPEVTVTTSGIMGVDPRATRSLTVSSIAAGSAITAPNDGAGDTLYAATANVTFTGSHLLAQGDLVRFEGTGTVLDGVQRVDRVTSGTVVRIFIEGITGTTTSGTAEVLTAISNPIVALRDYLTNEEYGVGTPVSELDEAAFEAMADVCDELVYMPEADAADSVKYKVTAVTAQEFSGVDYADLTLPQGTSTFREGDPFNGLGFTGDQAELNGRHQVHAVLDGVTLRVRGVTVEDATNLTGATAAHSVFENTRAVTGTTPSGASTILAVADSGGYGTGNTVMLAGFSGAQAPLNGLQTLTGVGVGTMTVAVTTTGSGTGTVQKQVLLQQFTVAGALESSNSLKANLERLLSSCRARLIYQAGKYLPSIRAGDATANAYLPNLNPDNIIGDWSFHLPGQDETANFLRGTYTEPRSSFQGAQVYYPDVPLADNAYLTADGGQLNIKELDLPLVQHPGRAIQLLAVMLRESRVAWRVSLRAKEAALNLAVDDLVTITHPTPGFVAQPFWVTRVVPLMDLTVQLELEAFDATAYDLYTPGDLRLIPQLHFGQAKDVYVAPTWREEPSSTASVGTLTLTVVDPQEHIRKVEFFTQSGRDAPTSWTEMVPVDDAAPYFAQVDLKEGVMSAIGYRITGVDAGGMTRVLVEKEIPFSASDVPSLTELRIVLDPVTGYPTVSWVGDNNVKSVKLMIGFDAVTSDSDVRSHPDRQLVSTRDGSLLWPVSTHLPLGEDSDLYPGPTYVSVSAFAYSETAAGGLEASRKVTAVAMYLPPGQGNGTVDVALNGAFSWVLNGLLNAQSARWDWFTSEPDSTDIATVASSGTLITGVGRRFTGSAGSGSVSHGGNVYVVVVQFTGTSGAGSELPSQVLIGSRQNETASRTVRYTLSESMYATGTAQPPGGLPAEYNKAGSVIISTSDRMRCQMDPDLAPNGDLVEGFYAARTLRFVLAPGAVISSVKAETYTGSPANGSARTDLLFYKKAIDVFDNSDANLIDDQTNSDEDFTWKQLTLTFSETVSTAAYFVALVTRQSFGSPVAGNTNYDPNCAAASDIYITYAPSNLESLL